ncbi:hypothetical protein [Oryza sativa Japonica Group]|uniref:Uncharacterized protein n=1 Tax=Oryza sativa subsp. japonica TaxID=39947 RepID=Q5JLA9_ORYSJ|nr:hypothetical protein [Oryza sativa Japonica Group]BAD87748.1 hypothetical protein [Oryza sativa Japonica Group]
MVGGSGRRSCTWAPPGVGPLLRGRLTERKKASRSRMGESSWGTNTEVMGALKKMGMGKKGTKGGKKDLATDICRRSDRYGIDQPV